MSIRSFFKTFFFVLICIVVLFSYRKIYLGFFQQDEWFSYGLYVLRSQSEPISLLKTIFAPSVGHYTPLNNLFLYGFFSLFRLNYLPYAVISITLHLANIMLVFYLGKIMYGRSLIAGLLALLFGVSAASYQATSWVIADLGVHISTIFSLLSLILFFGFVKKHKQRLFWFSMFSLVVSLFFKETPLGFFLLLPLVFFLFGRESLVKQKKWLFVILSFLLLYLAARALMIFLPNSYALDTLVTESQSIKDIVFNMITFPLKAISQSIIPSSFLLNFLNVLSDFLPESWREMKGTTEYELFFQTRVFDPITILLGTIALGITIVTWYKDRGSIWSKNFLVGIGLVVLNSPIFALTPEKAGGFSVIDSRNLYLPTIGTTIFIISLILKINRGNIQRAGILLLPLILLNIFWLDREISGAAVLGSLRRGILEKIKSSYPVLPGKGIFYTESDSSYYGLPPQEKLLPFQSGLGQTLLVWYSQTEDFPPEFFKDRFLWEIVDQGYRETAERGFGYFRDFDLLARTVREKNLHPSSIISFRYSSQGEILANNAEEVRGRLAGYLADKKEIDPRFFVITPSIKMEDTNLMFDRKRDTFWNSDVPYATPQTIDIDLRSQRKIAQLRVDSYNNRDQNEVGYEVSISQDGKDWRTVLFSMRYSPDDDGYVDLFFEPQTVRFIQIRQIGFHRYATWVVHELQVYEATN